ncbi:glycoside hydrolase family 43 protein [Streptomyces profundus]|uniref:glycoside hydrolase family 43 protein n=1 Tax=Streptomyces profundus TaxID=2867410 RepID=UPI001D16C40F|nr:glycoside hydrolase 43 family protein [Streptomyces sp. MA3_2.13]UED86715.1 glycoside hydrolase 43 family protein [Streptomyces sp. MA3_2.13]
MSPTPHPGRRGLIAGAAGLGLAAALPTLPPLNSPASAAAPPTGAPATGVRPLADFTNPVLWQDFADIDVIRVGDTFYYSASTMHYSPGAPVLRSWNLVDWEFAGHSVPRLDFGAKYDLDGDRAYVDGIWASTLNHRASEGRFYWLGQTDFSQTHVYTATDVEATWQRIATIPRSYFDAGLLFDGDTPYVAHGNTQIFVAQLTDDLTSEVRNEQVFTTPTSIGTLEGARFYKINGSYYIFLTRPANGQYILKSASPFGPYEIRELLLDLPGPIPGGGVPHQGGLVDTPGGDWYYLAFIDAYPGGRVPALAPITWTSDGWPQLHLVNGAWGTTYPEPALPPPPRETRPMTGLDTFAGTALDPRWEWNHNPDTGRFSVDNGLTLTTATVTDDLYAARNTLTHRVQGPTSTATIEIDHSQMTDGDRAGLALLRDSSAYLGLLREDGTTRLAMVDDITMDSGWNTVSTGTERATAPVPHTRMWLRARVDISPGAGRQAHFSYSTDGSAFTDLGPGLTLKHEWQFFLGYRFAIFHHATRTLGGSVLVASFDLTTP